MVSTHGSLCSCPLSVQILNDRRVVQYHVNWNVVFQLTQRFVDDK